LVVSTQPLRPELSALCWMLAARPALDASSWPVIRASLTIVSVMTDEQETISDAALEDQADITALTGVLPGPDGPLPLLVLDQRPEMAVRSGPAERVNLSVSALLSMGLTLVTTISEQLAQAMDAQAEALVHAQAASPGPWVLPPAPAPGWRLELSGRRAARLTAPDGSIMYGGECGQPRPWRALITRTNRCAVLIGAIGLYPNPGERAATRITTLLDQAAHAEELVGGLVEAC
jgi:hypothetical protein